MRVLTVFAVTLSAASWSCIFGGFEPSSDDSGFPTDASTDAEAPEPLDAAIPSLPIQFSLVRSDTQDLTSASYTLASATGDRLILVALGETGEAPAVLFGTSQLAPAVAEGFSMFRFAAIYQLKDRRAGELSLTLPSDSFAAVGVVEALSDGEISVAERSIPSEVQSCGVDQTVRFPPTSGVPIAVIVVANEESVLTASANATEIYAGAIGIGGRGVSALGLVGQLDDLELPFDCAGAGFAQVGVVLKAVVP